MIVAGVPRRQVAIRVLWVGVLLLASGACEGKATGVAVPAAATTGPARSGASAPIDGSFLKERDGPTIFVVQGGKKRAFPDMETFLAWGGKTDLSNVSQLSAEQLAAIPSGDTVRPGSRP